MPVVARPRNVGSVASLGTLLDRADGVGRGFDTLRVILSISILCWHSIATSYGRQGERPIWENPLAASVIASLLPIFFSLSGFLVMGSAMRTMSLPVFLTSRVLRIVPALAAEITISAVLLGAMVTTLTPAKYYTSAGFVRYFGSLIGKIQYSLPGVFTTNPLDNVVNTSLWTLAPELLCYTYIALVIATGLLGRRNLLSLFIVVGSIAAAAGDNFLFAARSLGDTARPHTLIAAFAFGNLIFLWRHRLPFSRWLFLICLLAGLVLASQAALLTAATPFLAYVTVCLGLLPLPALPLLKRGDYSYGIYLYAMPVQQSLAFAFPQLRQWYFNIAAALPVTILLAMASWSFIEKPALRLRRRIAGQSAGRLDKHNVQSSRWVIGALVAYGVWLSSTQYEIGLITQHRMWILMTALLLTSCALVSSYTSKSSALAESKP